MTGADNVPYISNCLQMLRWFIQVCFMSTIDKDLEILALRSQLAVVQQKITSREVSKPRFTIAFRQLWVLLSKFFLHSIPDSQAFIWGHQKVTLRYTMAPHKASGTVSPCQPGCHLPQEIVADANRIHRKQRIYYVGGVQ
jgi:hypothetical protein